jgi:hypothetical protein
MVRVYVSSTYADLKEYRGAVHHALRQLGHHVVAMEDYVAADARPADKCLADVASCDVYVGLLAWRYGFVPLHDNAEGRSITELEYRQALALDKPCLLFVLDEDTPWLPRLIDASTGSAGTAPRTQALRDEWTRERLVTMFKTPDDLARSVVTAIAKWEKERRAGDSRRRSGAASRSARPGIPKGYLGWLKAECGSVELLGLRLKQGQSVRLGHVYVPLTTTAGGEEAGTEEEQVAQRRGRPGAGERSPRLMLSSLGERSIYVSGDPGSGKSTFCRWVALVVAEGKVPSSDVAVERAFTEILPKDLTGRLPLLVPLRDFGDSLDSAPSSTLSASEFENTLIAWFDRKAYGGLSGDVVRGHRAHGSALLVMDGMDEVPPSRRATLLSGLGAAVRDWGTAKKKNRTLVHRPSLCVVGRGHPPTRPSAGADRAVGV